MTDYVTDCIRHAGRVKRYHAWPTIQTQTIGEHSWQVALIYEQIFGPLNPGIERYIRLHDVAELKVGDIPFPVKSDNPELKAAFTKVEDAALKQWGITLPALHSGIIANIKICDLLEMMCFGMTEREMGNMLAVPIIQRTRVAAIKLVADHKDAVYKFIDEAELRHERVLKGSA